MYIDSEITVWLLSWLGLYHMALCSEWTTLNEWDRWWDLIMAPRWPRIDYLGIHFKSQGKFQSQNYLQNPLGEWRVRSLNRSDTVGFLSIGTDCCQFCQLDHVV